MFPDAALWDIGGGDGSLNPLGVSLLTCLYAARVTDHDLSSQHWDFWVALVCQIIIIVGYFIFFRKEQLVRSLLSRIGSHLMLITPPVFRASRKQLVFLSDRGTRQLLYPAELALERDLVYDLPALNSKHDDNTNDFYNTTSFTIDEYY